MEKSELIKKVNKISKNFDSTSYSVESKVFYKKQKLEEILKTYTLDNFSNKTLQ